MEELQARIREIRALQTEANLASQPYSKLDNAENVGVQDGAKVVEIRDRSLAPSDGEEPGTVQRTPSKRKGQASSKRKAQTGQPKQKAFVPFHQLRDSNQQPYADELRRLEAQAERINQLLAERAQKKAQLEPSDDSIGDWEKVSKAERPERVAPTRSPNAGSKKVASKSSQHVYQSSGGGEVPPMSELNDEETESLKAQADRINQLLAELEATIRQGGAISEPPHSTYPSTEVSPKATQPDPVPPQPEIPGYFSEVPSFNSHNQPPSDRNLKQRVQEAGETAQALRYLANRERVIPPGDQYETRARPHPKRSGSNPIRRIGLRLRKFLQIPQKPIDRLGDAVLWIVLSAVARIGSQFLVMLYPALSPVVMVLMFVPPALAVYLAVFVPRAGFVSIYRLFLITLGLLLGGKLI
ncbi:hypothetical protein K9N68_32075 [Kovacikia minuta CCNUW1]|uniref:hypothetical protein n=1 Tax=Kovacikia minuta TaxID=2931930 RepID=UPI001CC994E7|nr:hypothetical protein [Kovacikia minuta]UBF26117.1 hypothetical protein K9N68_32075 [Kovacikia minuta CCNUW1]